MLSGKNENISESRPSPPQHFFQLTSWYFETGFATTGQCNGYGCLNANKRCVVHGGAIDMAK